MKPGIEHRRDQALLLGRLIAGHRDQLLGPSLVASVPQPEASPQLGGYDPDLRAALRAELAAVLGSEDSLAENDPEGLADRIAARLADDHHHSREVLWALLGGDDRLLAGEQAAAPQPRDTRNLEREPWWRKPGGGLLSSSREGWLARQGAAILMNLIVAATFITTWVVLWWPASDPPDIAWAVLALKAFAVWSLAFLPCWLYIRFLGQRAGALWDEYVLNLHRLGWDEPRFLPRPPRTSQFYDEWAADGGRTQGQHRNIYRQKFNAYYGRSVSDAVPGENFRVRLDTLFPVFLTTAVLAVCWTAVLWDDRFLQGPADVWDVLKFGFLGAYAFIAQTLVRRFFASDLRPSAYTSALLRVVVVLLGAMTIYQLLEIWLASDDPDARRWEAVAAFAIGFFPLAATQVVVRAASMPLRMSTRSLDSDYPLSQLDGLNIWYEARLAEENIDDMQNLATANFVDVVLHTRVPVGRLVDWVDQALLFMHLDRVEHGSREKRRAWRTASQSSTPMEAAESASAGPDQIALVTGSVGPGSRAGTRTRTTFRQLGIRTATDLLKAFPPDQIDPTRNGSAARSRQREWFTKLAGADLDLDQVRILVRVLDEEAALAPVWNWHSRGVRARSLCRRSRSDRFGEAIEAPQNGGNGAGPATTTS